MFPHADVVIVGAGIVGSALACALAEADKKLSILVLDSSVEVKCYEGKSFDPRVVALSMGSIHLLASLGVWSSIHQKGACPYKSMSVWDGEGNGSIAFHSCDVHLDSLGSIVENSVVLQALRERMGRFDHIQFLAPAEVETMTAMERGACLTLTSALEVTGDFIVGADGARSALRELLGIPTRSWDYGHSAIVTTVRTQSKHQNTAWQRFSHQGPLAFLPLADKALPDDSDEGFSEGHYCSIVWSLQDHLAGPIMELNSEEFCQRLGQTFEHKLGVVEWADKRHCIPLRQRHVLSYGRPGLALVGDAAHTIHPLAGLGVNLGLADVQSLRDEILRARLRSIPLTDPSIIKRYQRSRKPQNLATMLAMEGFKRLFEQKSLGLNSLRNRGMDWVDGKDWLKRLIIEGATR